MDFTRANSYTDKSALDNDSRFKTQQRLRGLQLELAEKQCARLVGCLGILCSLALV
jgi:hypothetical protein